MKHLDSRIVVLLFCWIILGVGCEGDDPPVPQTPPLAGQSGRDNRDSEVGSWFVFDRTDPITDARTITAIAWHQGYYTSEGFAQYREPAVVAECNDEGFRLSLYLAFRGFEQVVQWRLGDREYSESSVWNWVVGRSLYEAPEEVALLWVQQLAISEVPGRLLVRLGDGAFDTVHEWTLTGNREAIELLPCV